MTDRKINKVPVGMVEGLQEMIDEASVMVKREDIMAYEGQTVFHLENGEYVPNQNRIKVFVGGVPQYSPENFLESSQTTITFHDGLPNFTVVHVEYLQGIAPIVGDITAAIDELRESLERVSSETKTVPDGDWNNALENGVYTSLSSVDLNAPSNGWWIGTVMVYDEDWVVQTLINYTSNNSERYIRVKNNGVWRGWVRLDSGDNVVKEIPEADWNNALETGVYTSITDVDYNAPTQGYFLGHVMAHDENWVVQEVVDNSSENLERYIRAKISGIWHPWTRVGKSDNSGLEEVTNIRLSRNKLSWVNPTTSNFLGVYVFGSDEDISTWDIHQCATYTTQLADGDVSEAIMNPYPHIRLYFKIFCEYEISGVPVFSSGATTSSMSASAFYYEEGNEYELLTDGWITGYVTGIVTTDKNTNHLYMAAPGNNAFASFISSGKVNLTNVKRLALDWVRSAAGTGAAMQVASLVNGDSTDFVASLPAPTTRGITYLDVSTLTGNYHIRVAAASGATLQVYKIWGEY